MLAASAQSVTLTPPGQQTGAVTSFVGPQKVVGAKTVVTVSLLVTKNSGTVAGNANLQASNASTPGANDWADIGTQQTVTDATATYHFKDAPAGYQWYRIRVTSTTGTYTPTGQMIIRK